MRRCRSRLYAALSTIRVNQVSSVGFAAEGRDLLVGVHVRFLHDVLGFAVVVDHAARHAEQALVTAPHDLAECVAIAAAGRVRPTRRRPASRSRWRGWCGLRPCGVPPVRADAAVHERFPHPRTAALRATMARSRRAGATARRTGMPVRPRIAASVTADAAMNDRCSFAIASKRYGAVKPAASR